MLTYAACTGNSKRAAPPPTYADVRVCSCMLTYAVCKGNRMRAAPPATYAHVCCRKRYAGMLTYADVSIASARMPSILNTSRCVLNRLLKRGGGSAKYPPPLARKAQTLSDASPLLPQLPQCKHICSRMLTYAACVRSRCVRSQTHSMADLKVFYSFCNSLSER
jgi:hypothetical protein